MTRGSGIFHTRQFGRFLMHLYFDLDGTLYRTECAAVHAVQTLFAELDIPAPPDRQILSCIGKTTDCFLQSLLPLCIQPGAVRDRFRELDHQAVREHGRLFAGVTQLLEQLRAAGHRLSVCSNGSLQYIDLVLESTGIGVFFEHRYTAKNSPSKADFLKTVLTSDELSVFVGDTGDDVDAAKLNHLPSIAAAYGYGDPGWLRKATFMALSPPDILSAVHQMEIFSVITDELIRPGGQIIGINGIDTSGKTVFTENFSRYLSDIGYKCAVIHIDDFHNPLELRRSGADELDAYYHNAFDYDKLIAEVLRPYKENGRIDRDVLCLNLDTDQYELTRHYVLDENTVVLLEGVLLFRAAVTGVSRWENLSGDWF